MSLGGPVEPAADSASVDVGAPGTTIVSEWAGTEVVFADDGSAGVGNRAFSPAGQSWVASLQDYGSPVHGMSDPSAFNGPYSPNVDHRADRSFDFGAADVATVSVLADYSVRDPGDFFRILYDPAGGVPGLVLDELTNVTINGTSRAAPHVAGLAAMVMAYNTSYTYLDVIGAVKNGGTPVSALAGKATTGRR